MATSKKKNKKNEISENIEENEVFLESDMDFEAKIRLEKNDKLIQAEKKKLLKILSKIDKNLIKIADSLIENIAFMSVTLDDLMQTIKSKGVIEEYCNGKNQFGFKESVEIKIYNTMQKNFQSSMKVLIDLLQKDDSSGDEAKEQLKKIFARGRT